MAIEREKTLWKSCHFAPLPPFIHKLAQMLADLPQHEKRNLLKLAQDSTLHKLVRNPTSSCILAHLLRRAQETEIIRTWQYPFALVVMHRHHTHDHP
jgi:hypothetical protein